MSRAVSRAVTRVITRPHEFGAGGGEEAGEFGDASRLGQNPSIHPPLLGGRQAFHIEQAPQEL